MMMNSTLFMRDTCINKVKHLIHTDMWGRGEGGASCHLLAGNQ